jgi:class 3 adenylate cyclase
MSVPDIYLCLLDIHGYTKFCHQNRMDPRMLNLLDLMVQVDVPTLARAEGVMSRRARGDEILLVGATPGDVFAALLKIMAYLGGRLEAPKGEGGADLAARSAALPVFQISAGIAGGQKYSSLLITRDGDLSGDIVNVAARLQSRANSISPERDKILVTSHVYQKLKEAIAEPRLGGGKIDFVSTGVMEFKGVSLVAYELVFLDREPHRLACAAALEELYDSLGKGLWKTKVFTDALHLASRLVTSREDLIFRPSASIEDRPASADTVLEGIRRAEQLRSGERFSAATDALASVVADLRRMEDGDDLAMHYLEAVLEGYERIRESYLAKVDEQMYEHLDAILAGKERENFAALKRYHEAFSMVRDAARLKVEDRKAIWQGTADGLSPELHVSFSVKK